MGILEVTAQRRHFKFAVICNLDADCTYLREDAYHSLLSGPLLLARTRTPAIASVLHSAVASERRQPVVTFRLSIFRFHELWMII